MHEIYINQHEYYEPPSCVSHMPTDPDGEHADDDAENADFKGWRSLSSLLRRRGRGLLTGHIVLELSVITGKHNVSS